MDEYGEFLHMPGQKFFDFNKIREEIVRETETKVGRNAGISPADYPKLMARDPFANGSTAIDAARFLPTNTSFPYEQLNTSETYTITNVTISDAGAYYAVITNRAGADRSITAYLYVFPPPTMQSNLWRYNTNGVDLGASEAPIEPALARADAAEAPAEASSEEAAG